VLTLISGLMISTSLVAWMSPTIAGLLLAILLSWVSGKLSIGLFLRRIGLLVTPEEGQRPRVASRAEELAQALEPAIPMGDPLLAIHSDARLREVHEAILTPPPRRERGVIEPDRAMAEAKLLEARTAEEAISWLKPGERMVLLHDRALIDMLCRLPRQAEYEAQAA
jgi:membrane glycosyltransferase